MNSAEIVLAAMREVPGSKIEGNTIWLGKISYNFSHLDSTSWHGEFIFWVLKYVAEIGYIPSEERAKK